MSDGQQGRKGAVGPKRGVTDFVTPSRQIYEMLNQLHTGWDFTSVLKIGMVLCFSTGFLIVIAPDDFTYVWLRVGVSVRYVR